MAREVPAARSVAVWQICVPLSVLRTVNDSVLFDSVVSYVEIRDFKNDVVTLAEIEALPTCGEEKGDADNEGGYFKRC